MQKYCYIIMLFVLPFFFISCKSEKDQSKQNEQKIYDLLKDCEFDISDLDSSLSSDKTVKLDKHLSFISAHSIHVRKRGVLLKTGKVITSLALRASDKSKSAYAVLFDGVNKMLIDSVLLGPNLHVISVLEEEGNRIKMEALVREGGQPAKKISNFYIEVNSDSLSLEE